MLAALMKSWQINAAVRLLHDMPSRQILPDTCSFNTVMGTLAREPLLGPVSYRFIITAVYIRTVLICFMHYSKLLV